MFSRLIEFLFSLQHVRIGSNTHFAFVWQYPVLMTLGAILLAVLGFFSYWPQAASPAKKKVMGVVRAVLLIFVFLLLFRPELVMERDQRTRSVVAVWLDSSASMQLQDPYTGAKADPAMHEFLQHVLQDATTTRPSATAPSTPGVAPSGARPDRFQVAAAALAQSGWLQELADVQDVAFFTGSAHAQPVGVAYSRADIAPLLVSLRHQLPEGDATDVPAVVREILEKEQGQRVSAIVLLTDGQTTEKGSRLDQAAVLAQEANTRILAVAIGQEDEPFDLKIDPPRLPQSTFPRDPVFAHVRVSATGVTRPTPVRISIYRKPATRSTATMPAGGGIAGDGDSAAAIAALGVPLATKEVTFDPNKKEIDTEVPLKLDKKDKGKSERFDLVIRVDPVASGLEELYRNNNQAAASVTVLDAQINVLYVEGYPRWEFRYLKNELIREPTVNVASLLESADEDFTQDADPPVRDKQTGEETFPGSLRRFPDTAQDLAKFDVLILGDIEPTYFSPTQQKLIVNWVKTRGGGMAWIAGPNFNPEAYRETPLEVLLPITADEIDPRARILQPSDNTPYNLALTPAGRDTNLFRFFDDPDLSWKQVADLPQMYWYKPVQGIKPGAIVLAVHPVRTIAGNPAPLLVTRQYGAGPVLFSAYSDTWRWRNYTGEPLFQSYWLQMCRLLYANKALGQSKRLELAVDNARMEIGQPIKVSLTVKDPTLAAQLPQEVPVVVMDKDGQSVDTITLTRAPGGSLAAAVDKLEGAVTASRIGDFSLVIRPGSLPIDIPPVEFAVERSQREFENVTADVPSLRAIAAKTTGKVVPPFQAATLLREIPDRSIPVILSQPEELWNKPIMLVLVLLLATTEWLIRKSAGLI